MKRLICMTLLFTMTVARAQVFTMPKTEGQEISPCVDIMVHQNRSIRGLHPDPYPATPKGHLGLSNSRYHSSMEKMSETEFEELFNLHMPESDRRVGFKSNLERLFGKRHLAISMKQATYGDLLIGASTKAIVSGDRNVKVRAYECRKESSSDYYDLYLAKRTGKGISESRQKSIVENLDIRKGFGPITNNIFSTLLPGLVSGSSSISVSEHFLNNDTHFRVQRAFNDFNPNALNREYSCIVEYVNSETNKAGAAFVFDQPVASYDEWLERSYKKSTDKYVEHNYGIEENMSPLARKLSFTDGKNLSIYKNFMLEEKKKKEPGKLSFSTYYNNDASNDALFANTYIRSDFDEKEKTLKIYSNDGLGLKKHIKPHMLLSKSKCREIPITEIRNQYFESYPE